MTFAEHVQKKKREKQLTTAQLSAMSGVPLATLNKLLCGVIEEPKLATALAIAKALDCPLSILAENVDAEADLADEERNMLTDFRKLGPYGRSMVRTVMDLELGRQADEENLNDARVDPSPSGKTISLPLFLFPVSAGVGTMLEGSDTETIEVRATPATERANFAVRVSGNSMEPKFRDGDILLIHQQPELYFGELGIFVADGEGYFKRYMGDRLHSLNPAYPDMQIATFKDFLCCGKVVGHMRRRTL